MIKWKTVVSCVLVSGTVHKLSFVSYLLSSCPQYMYWMINKNLYYVTWCCNTLWSYLSKLYHESILYSKALSYVFVCSHVLSILIPFEPLSYSIYVYYEHEIAVSHRMFLLANAIWFDSWLSKHWAFNLYYSYG